MDETITDRVETALRADIATGRFSPRSKLRVEQLKDLYSVGASPIREALSRLLAEGLVQIEVNKGFRVPGLSRIDLYDLAITRAGVERAALKRSIERGGDDWESGIVASLHRYKLASRRFAENSGDDEIRVWELAHDDLHRSMVAACDATRLLVYQEKLLVQHARYRRLVLPPSVGVDNIVREHEQLVDVILSRDLDGALTLIDRHMMITVDVLDRRGFWEP